MKQTALLALLQLIVVPKLTEQLELSYAENRRLQTAFDEAADDFDRVAQAFHDNHGDPDGPPPMAIRTAFTELNELRNLRGDGAIDELEFHMNAECPLHNDILVTECCPTRWHSNHMCPMIHGLLEIPTLHHVRPCPAVGCAERWTTPWIPDQQSGESLMTRQLEGYIEDAQYAPTMQR